MALDNPFAPDAKVEEYFFNFFKDNIENYQEKYHDSFSLNPVRVAVQGSSVKEKQTMIVQLREMAADGPMDKFKRSVFGLASQLGAKDFDVTVIVDELEEIQYSKDPNASAIYQSSITSLLSFFSVGNFDQFNRFLRLESPQLFKQQILLIIEGVKKKRFRTDDRFAWLVDSKFTSNEFARKAIEKIAKAQEEKK